MEEDAVFHVSTQVRRRWCFAEGTLRLVMCGSSVHAAECSVPGFDEAYGVPLEYPAMCALAANGELKMSIDKFVRDRADSLLHLGANEALKHALQCWRAVFGAGADSPGITNADAARITGCCATMISTFRRNEPLKTGGNDTWTTPSVLRRLLRWAIHIELNPQDPLRH